MKYSVIVEADGATPDQVTAARGEYLAVLTLKLGGEDRVLTCFRAWGRGVEQGLSSLTPTEDRDSAAWILAVHDAETAGRAHLGGIPKPTFTFAMKA